MSARTLYLVRQEYFGTCGFLNAYEDVQMSIATYNADTGADETVIWTGTRACSDTDGPMYPAYLAIGPSDGRLHFVIGTMGALRVQILEADGTPVNDFALPFTLPAVDPCRPLEGFTRQTPIPLAVDLDGTIYALSPATDCGTHLFAFDTAGASQGDWTITPNPSCDATPCGITTIAVRQHVLYFVSYGPACSGCADSRLVRRYDLLASEPLAPLGSVPEGVERLRRLLSDTGWGVAMIGTGAGPFFCKLWDDGSVGLEAGVGFFADATTLERECEFWQCNAGTYSNETVLETRCGDTTTIITNPSTIMVVTGEVVGPSPGVDCPRCPQPPPGPGDTYTIRRLRRFSHLSDQQTQIFVDRLELYGQSGVGLLEGQGSDPQIFLRISKDGGHTWSTEQSGSFGTLGAYAKRVIWRQLGQGRDWVFEFTCSDPVEWFLIQALADVRKGTS